MVMTGTFGGVDVTVKDYRDLMLFWKMQHRFCKEFQIRKIRIEEPPTDGQLRKMSALLRGKLA